MIIYLHCFLNRFLDDNVHKYSIEKTLQKKVEDLPELLKTNVELILGNHDVGCDIKNIKIFYYVNLLLDFLIIN